MLMMAADGAASHEMLVTMVAAIAAGTMLLVLARRANLPALLLLLLGGLAMGPQALGIVRPDSLGDGLLVVVELAVGLILFEGGLTLDRQGYRAASAMIKRLLTLGVLITWLGATLAIRLVAGVPWSQSVIAASLIIVTGPTVIGPLLKRVRIAPRLHNILHWEAVLIEPIGVFIAVLCFEWFAAGQGAGALVNLGLRVLAGGALGLAAGAFITAAIRYRLVPRDMHGIFALACAVLVFGAAESLIVKAGLLAVIVAGFVVGLSGLPALRGLRAFKAELTSLLIATLFILLAARLNFAQFEDFGLRGAAVVVLVMLAVRPVSVWLCALGLDLPVRERVFLAWVAPRGIVAASMASLFAISLEERGAADARFAETFTYSVIVATIVLQGTTAGLVARALGVHRPEPEGWLIVGAHPFARRIASFLEGAAGERTVLLDTNARAVHEAVDAGHTALVADARETDVLERHGLAEIGHVLALTDNEDLNARICAGWSGRVGAEQVFRYRSTAAVGTLQDEQGVVLWPGLPRPTLLSAEIERNEASVETFGGAELPVGAVPLAAFDGRRLRFDPPSGTPGERVLCLRRRADYLLRSIRPDLVITEARGDLESLFEQIVSRMAAAQPRLPREATVAELLQREAAFPSVIGSGVAVPHAYSSGLPQRLCGIACSREGVRFPGAAEPVRLVFLVLSPAGDPEGHLATLAEIARLVLAPEVRERLLEAGSPMEVVHLVRRRGSAP